MQEPKKIYVSKELEPLVLSGSIFRAFYEWGQPLYISGESLDALKQKVEAHETVEEFVLVDTPPFS